MNLQIKEIMSIKGVTSASLADQIGLSKVAISNIITGKSLPSLETLMKMSEVLHVSISELIGEKDIQDTTTLICPHCGKPINIKLT